MKGMLVNLFKKGDPDPADPDNYKGICLLGITGKLFG